MIPVEDRAWLLAALGDALGGGAPILPLSQDASPEAYAGVRAPAETALVIRTSGSTGIPKSVALSVAALTASAAATHVALGGAGQWLVTLPAHLISGVQMLVRSTVAGTDPVFCDGPFDAETMLQQAELLSHDRRYVSLVPVQFARLLDLAEADGSAADALREFDAILVGGQGVPLAMRQRAYELGISLHRSYGMTETAGGCVYDGVEIGDTRLRIREGEVQIAGPTLALGYLGDPLLTADRFVVDRGTRWYRSGDAGELLGGMLTVTGRLDRVIISGGVNVSLDEVEREIAEHSGWEHSVVIAVADEEWGERPLLVVERRVGEVPADAVPFETVRSTVNESLGPAAAPDRAVEVAELPRLPGGKPDHNAVAALIG